MPPAPRATRRQSAGHRMVTRSSSRKVRDEDSSDEHGDTVDTTVYHIDEEQNSQQDEDVPVPSPRVQPPLQAAVDADDEEEPTQVQQDTQPIDSAAEVVKPVSESRCSSTLRLAAIVAFYFITSISVVLFNKHLFSSNLKDSTVFITWVQLVFTAVISIAVSLYSTGALGITLPKLLYTLPLSINFCFMLVLNNLCLAYVHVSFYQVARAWTVVMSMILSFIVFRIRPTIYQVICTIAIAIGYIMACDGEIQWGDVYVDLLKMKSCGVYLVRVLSANIIPMSTIRDLTAHDDCSPIPIVLGLLLGLFSSLVLAIYSIRMKTLFKTTNIDNNSMLLSVNLNSSIILFVYLIASKSLFSTLAQPELWSPDVMMYLLIVSAAGYLLNIATIMQVKNTSALTHNVSGTAKASLQSVLGWWIYQNPVSQRTLIGTIITILGCGVYAMVPQGKADQEDEANRPPVQDVARYPAWARFLEPPTPSSPSVPSAPRVEYISIKKRVQ